MAKGQVLEPDTSQIIITEVLLRSRDVPSFIEIYNKGDKGRFMSGMRLARIEDGQTVSIVPIRVPVFYIFPKEYVVLTPDSMALNDLFPEVGGYQLRQNTLPSLQGTFGLGLLNGAGRLLQMVPVDPLLQEEGLRNLPDISLEMKSITAGSNERANWSGPITRFGLMTPGKTNTHLRHQDIDPILLLERGFYLSDKSISPDGDGFKDELIVNYELKAGGYQVKMVVVDSHNRPLKEIYNGVLPLAEGQIKWIPKLNNGRPLPTGGYGLTIIAEGPDGKEIIRLPFAVGYLR